MTPNHQAIATQLKDHLDAELAAHRQLLGVAERKQHDLVANDMAAFTRVLAEEQAVLFETNRLRQIRERLLRAVVTVLGLTLPDLALTPIIDRLPEPLKGEVARRRADLVGVIERVRALNERNMLLIRQGLSFSRELLAAIVGDSGPTPAYDRRGLNGYAPATRGSLVNLAG